MKKNKPKSPPMRPATVVDAVLDDPAEQEALDAVRLVTDGRPGPWGERIIALYRTIESAQHGMDGLHCVPDELGMDMVLFYQARTGLRLAGEMLGKMVLNQLRVPDDAPDAKAVQP